MNFIITFAISSFIVLILWVGIGGLVGLTGLDCNNYDKGRSITRAHLTVALPHKVSCELHNYLSVKIGRY
jgi:hypothetical protein